MELLFLGTGAADWQPDVKDGAGYHRRFSSCLVDGSLLIDPGPHVPDALAEYGIDPHAIRYVLVTHPHRDHLSRTALQLLTDAGAVLIDPRGTDCVKAGKYTVRAYAANHATAKGAVHYLIDDGEKRLYYALDGAWLTYPEYRAIRDGGVSLAVLDATVGDVRGDWRIFEHNNLAMVEEMVHTLRPHVGRFVISHMAYTLHTDHPTLVARMAPLGITVAYDGFKTEI